MSEHRQSVSDYVKWLEGQIRLYRKARRTLDLMKDPRYKLIPLHMRPDLLEQCCKLLNSEWKRSDTARLKSLVISSDFLPACLLLLFNNNVLGHCKVSLVHGTIDSVIIESFVIDAAYRFKGYGSLFLGSIEEYLIKRYGIVNIYLMTKGQEEFYLKNGFTICEPIEQFNNRYRDFGPDPYFVKEDDDFTPRKREPNEVIEDNEWKQRERYMLGLSPAPLPPKKFVDDTSTKKSIPKEMKFIESGAILKMRSVFEKDSNTNINTNPKVFKSKGAPTPPVPPPMPKLGKASIPICLTISNRTFMKKTLESDDDQSSTET